MATTPDTSSTAHAPATPGGRGPARVLLLGNPDTSLARCLTRFPQTRLVLTRAGRPIGGDPLWQDDSGRFDLAVLTGPLADLEAEIRLGLRLRLPLLAEITTALEPAALDRLARAVAKRRMRAAVAGSLRLLPGFARAREVVVSGVLGAIRSVAVFRPPVPDPTGERMERVRDLDLVAWLAGTTAETCRIRRVGERLGVFAGTPGDSGCSGEEPAGTAPEGWYERRLVVTGGLGVLSGHVAAPPADRPGTVRPAALVLEWAGRRRLLAVPEGEALVPDCAVALDAVLENGFPSCLPTLSESSTATAVTENFFTRNTGGFETS